MAKSKIGAFIHHIETPGVLDQMAEYDPAVLKITGNMDQIRKAASMLPLTTIIGRAPNGQTSPDLEGYKDGLGISDPHHAAIVWTQENLNDMLSAPQVRWESFNEQNSHHVEYAEFEKWRIIEMSKYGLHACVGNFGVGWPDLNVWPIYSGMLSEANRHGSCLGLHEYFAMYPWIWYGQNQSEQILSGNIQHFPINYADGWTTFRYRKVARDVLMRNGWNNIPIVLTEMGADWVYPEMVRYLNDGEVVGPYLTAERAWRRAHISDSVEVAYLRMLQWMDVQMLRDPYLIGGTVFTLGTVDPGNWRNYNIAGTMWNKLLAYVREPRLDISYMQTEWDEGVFLRSRPDKNSDILAIIFPKEYVLLLHQEGRYFKVREQVAGREGYIEQIYLRGS